MDDGDESDPEHSELTSTVRLVGHDAEVELTSSLESDDDDYVLARTAPLPEPLNSPGGQGSGPVAAPDPRRAAWEQRVRPPTTTSSCTANANPSSHAAPCTISSIDAIAQDVYGGEDVQRRMRTLSDVPRMIVRTLGSLKPL